eukprot:435652-Pyramimonas_sp.AAC.1
MKWARESWPSTPGAVRRHVQQAPPMEWEGRDSTGAITTDKQTLLQTAASEWNAMWSDPVGKPADISHMMGQCLAAAREAPLPPITILDVDAALPTLPEKKAKGKGVLNPTDIQRQPQLARQALADTEQYRAGWGLAVAPQLGAWSCDPQGSRGQRSLGVGPDAAQQLAQCACEVRR